MLNMALQTCQNCGHQNSKQAKRCQNCTAVLNAAVTQDDDETLLDQTVHVDDRTTKIEAAKVSDETLATRPNHAAEVIDSALVTSTVNIDYDDEGESQFGSLMISGDLLLTHEASNTVFRIPHDQLNEVVIGRKNRQTNFMPTVDLAALEGHTNGVSRRHATLLRKGNWLVLIDHQSKNGTTLNGQPLTPEQPRIVRDGDTIRVGLINLLVSYQK
jgi:hypothetical protein